MAGLTARLPIYALAEMGAANAAFWAALAVEFRQLGVAGVPCRLLAGSPVAPHEIGPAALFSQVCGYPLETLYRGQYQLLGVPNYDALGCNVGRHRAFIMVREGANFRHVSDLRGGVFALNSRHSNTGANLPRLMFARVAEGRRMFQRVIETGSHVASLEALTAGMADAASIDCVTLAFVRDHRPASVAGLRVLAETAESPAIPFVTAAETPANVVAALRKGLAWVGSGAQHQSIRGALRLSGIGLAEPSTYGGLLTYAQEAAALGYQEIA